VPISHLVICQLNLLRVPNVLAFLEVSVEYCVHIGVCEEMLSPAALLESRFMSDVLETICDTRDRTVET